MLRLLSDIKLYKENNQKAFKSEAIIFIDYTSAFDNVDWKILFKILKKYKINKESINNMKLLY